LLGVGERGAPRAEAGHSAVQMRRRLQVGNPVALHLHPLMVAYEVKRSPYVVHIDTQQLPFPGMTIACKAETMCR
jgi:hypothetical protein